MKSYLALIDLRDSALSLGKLEFAAACETDMRLMIEEQHHYALDMNRVISTGQGYDKFHAAQREYLQATHISWMKRRKPVRDAACEYKAAFTEYLHALDHDNFTGACIAWLNAMDEALAMNEPAYYMTNNLYRILGGKVWRYVAIRGGWLVRDRFVTEDLTNGKIIGARAVDQNSADFFIRCADETAAARVYVVVYDHPNGDRTEHGKFTHAARESAYNLAKAMSDQYCAPGHEIYVDIR